MTEEEDDIDDDASPDLPEGIEEFIDRLMSALGDKDTIVRYSAAKYLSRLSVLLPRSMSSQIVEAVISLFEGTADDPAVITDKGKVLDPGGGAGHGGEGRWHGICLAIAEMARRGVVDRKAISSLLPWAIRVNDTRKSCFRNWLTFTVILQSLKFDLRRGAHSIGSNVRDAAAYLLWSLARATSPEILRPFALELAQTLVTVACLDREVGVRRAASAAFQEHVGRMVRTHAWHGDQRMTNILLVGPLPTRHSSAWRDRFLHGQRSSFGFPGSGTEGRSVSPQLVMASVVADD